MNLNQVTLPVKNMTQACEFYLTLGFEQIVDTPHYARFLCPMGDATFSLILESDEHINGAIIYFEHPQLSKWVNELSDRGIRFDTQLEDKPYLWQEASLRDPSGNRIKLYCAGTNRKNPPWRVSKKLNIKVL